MTYSAFNRGETRGPRRGGQSTPSPNASSGGAGNMSAADKVKLDGVQAGATANSTDAFLLARTNHTGAQAIATVTGLQTSLDAKAPLASPSFTGIPAAPTAAGGTNTTQLATTAFVAAAIATLINAAPGLLDTLDEIAAALGDDPNFAATMTTALANKQPLDSDLSAIAALTSAANKLAYATGAGSWALADFTAFGRTLAALADAAAGRTALGLGTAAVEGYSTGSYTPAVAFGGASVGVTYGATNGATWVKIGKLVYITGRLALTAKGSSVGNATITGLPFAAAVTNAGHATLGLYSNVTTITGTLFANLANGSTTATLFTTPTTVLTDANFQNTTAIGLHFWYVATT